MNVQKLFRLLRKIALLHICELNLGELETLVERLRKERRERERPR
jgi:hypothetical protein